MTSQVIYCLGTCHDCCAQGLCESGMYAPCQRDDTDIIGTCPSVCRDCIDRIQFDPSLIRDSLSSKQSLPSCGYCRDENHATGILGNLINSIMSLISKFLENAWFLKLAKKGRSAMALSGIGHFILKGGTRWKLGKK